MSIDIEGDRGPLTGEEIRETAGNMAFPWAGGLDVQPSDGFEGVDPGDADPDYDEDEMPDDESMTAEEFVSALNEEADRQTRTYATLFALANRGATHEDIATFLTPFVDYMGVKINQYCELLGVDPSSLDQDE